MADAVGWIEADWPAPPGIRAGTTTRAGGGSRGHWASLNLAAHVDDDTAAVAANRARLRDALRLPAEPFWLEQVHGKRLVEAGDTGDRRADGSWTRAPGVVCAVLTADCLPVLLCDRAGTRVAAVHGGWRGLAAGVIGAAVEALAVVPADIMAWLGPAIGPDAFEVGAEVRSAFLAVDAGHEGDFRPGADGRWLADLYGIARRQLLGLGVSGIYGGGYCTFRDAGRFYSYRRDGTTGRMASLIWRVAGG